jgi:hypothetical protein
MKKLLLGAAMLTASAAPMLVPSAASAAKPDGPPVATGTITLEGLTLAGTQYGTPSGLPTTVATDPLSIPATVGDTFTYSTITCTSPFPPWNNVGLHFAPDYPGLADPASVRHEVQGSVVAAAPNGKRVVVDGTITSYLCESGVRTDQIVTSFHGVLAPTTASSVTLAGNGPVPTTGGLEIKGGFHIVGGTGRFADMTGGGTITGQFTCLRTTLQRNAVQTCAGLGGYSEVPFQLNGHFADRTV